jgi:hypothetical protein
MIDTMAIMHTGGPIEADADPDIIPCANVDDRVGQQEAVGLEMEARAGTDPRSHDVARALKLRSADEQGFAAVKDDAKRALLRGDQMRQLVCEREDRPLKHSLWLIAPRFVAHVVDVAIIAVEVAPARQLDENGVDDDHEVPPNAS